MKILQLNNYADPLGGAEVYAHALTRELRNRGHTVGFFGTSPERESDEELERIVRRPRYDARVLLRDPLVRVALEGYLQRLRPDLIHVHNVFSLGIDVLECLARAGAPVVQTVHDFSLLCPNSWCVHGDGTPCTGVAGAKCFQHDCQRNYPFDPEVALHTLLKQRTLAAVVRLAICPSRHLADLMQRSGSRDVVHLNYFIDPIVSAQDGEAQRRASKELVYIGRLEPEKGVELLLAAMPSILETHPDARLTVVGGGSSAEALVRRAAELDLEAAVEFRSQVPRAELGAFYATSTACILPSIWTENSPLVAYECLAAGLPMIASRIGGIPELVEEGRSGFTFEPRDPHDLAAKVRQLLALTPEERARLSARMRERARDFVIPVHMGRIAALYSRALESPAGPAPDLPIDGDTLAVLDEFARERNRLDQLVGEHIDYIRHLEKTLASEVRVTSPGSADLVHELRDSLEDHKRRLQLLEAKDRGFLRRIARALHLPKVFKG